jgi:hypothetical protein
MRRNENEDGMKMNEWKQLTGGQPVERCLTPLRKGDERSWSENSHGEPTA